MIANRINTLLYVDDDPDDLEVVFTVMRDLDPNIQLKSASNGEEGIRSLHANCPDLILLDYNMPKMNGIEVLKNIDRSCLEKSRIVFYSTYMLDHQVDQCLTLGATGYFKKPSSLSEIREIAQSLINPQL